MRDCRCSWRCSAVALYVCLSKLLIQFARVLQINPYTQTKLSARRAFQAVDDNYDDDDAGDDAVENAENDDENDDDDDAAAEKYNEKARQFPKHQK